ncbi:MAG: hypothetical protein ACKN9F_07775 [Methylomonas sp.]
MFEILNFEMGKHDFSDIHLCFVKDSAFAKSYQICRKKITEYFRMDSAEIGGSRDFFVQSIGKCLAIKPSPLPTDGCTFKFCRSQYILNGLKLADNEHLSNQLLHTNHAIRAHQQFNYVLQKSSTALIPTLECNVTVAKKPCP